MFSEVDTFISAQRSDITDKIKIEDGMITVKQWTDPENIAEIFLNIRKTILAIRVTMPRELQQDENIFTSKGDNGPFICIRQGIIAILAGLVSNIHNTAIKEIPEQLQYQSEAAQGGKEMNTFNELVEDNELIARYGYKSIKYGDDIIYGKNPKKYVSAGLMKMLLQISPSSLTDMVPLPNASEVSHLCQLIKTNMQELIGSAEIELIRKMQPFDINKRDIESEKMYDDAIREQVKLYLCHKNAMNDMTRAVHISKIILMSFVNIVQGDFESRILITWLVVLSIMSLNADTYDRLKEDPLYGMTMMQGMLIGKYLGLISEQVIIDIISGVKGDLEVEKTNDIGPTLIYNSRKGRIETWRGQMYTCISHSWGRGKWDKEDGTRYGVKWQVPYLICGLKEYHAFDISNIVSDEYIWLDWVCINQEDEQEKLCEIRKQEYIFRNANKVIFWNHGEQDWVDAVVFYMEHGFTNCNKDEIDKCLEGLYTVKNSLWLTSLWTLQELWLRKDMCVYSNGKIILMSNLSAALSTITLHEVFKSKSNTSESEEVIKIIKDSSLTDAIRMSKIKILAKVASRRVGHPMDLIFSVSSILKLDISGLKYDNCSYEIAYDRLLTIVANQHKGTLMAFQVCGNMANGFCAYPDYDQSSVPLITVSSMVEKCVYKTEQMDINTTHTIVSTVKEIYMVPIGYHLRIVGNGLDLIPCISLLKVVECNTRNLKTYHCIKRYILDMLNFDYILSDEKCSLKGVSGITYGNT